MPRSRIVNQISGPVNAPNFCVQPDRYSLTNHACTGSVTETAGVPTGDTDVGTGQGARLGPHTFFAPSPCAAIV